MRTDFSAALVIIATLALSCAAQAQQVAPPAPSATAAASATPPLPTAAVPAAPKEAAPALIQIALTQEEAINAVNILNEFVKGVGLTQPERIGQSVVIFRKLQDALRAAQPAPGAPPPAAPPKP